MLNVVIQLYILSELKTKQCRTLIIHTVLNKWHDPIFVSEILVHLTPFAKGGWLQLTLVAVISGFPTRCHCRMGAWRSTADGVYRVLKNAKFLLELKML